MKISLAFTLLFAFVLSSCTTKTTEPPPQPTTTSFARIQEKVIDASCVPGCHTPGSYFIAQAQLVLDKDSAYANLVGIPAHNANAKADGLLRVKAGDPDNSFLFMKLHGIPLGKQYGAMMPLGMKPLSVGKTEFIRQWITTGAKLTGDDIDPKLLDDTTQPVVAAFTPLPPPAAGEGFQTSIGKFDVASSFERELFVYKNLGNPTEMYVNRIQTRMRTGSHHFVLYTFDASIPASVKPPYDVVRDIRAPDGKEIEANKQPMNYHIYFGGTQMGGDVDYTLPPGVALRIPPNTGLDLNTHYVNYTGETMPGECYANLYTVPESQVQHVAQPLNLGNYNFTLPAKKRTTITTNFTNTYGIPMNVFLMTSHTHAMMENFVVKIKGGPRNGEIIYETTDWAHPGIKNFSTPIVLQNGEGLTSEVTYNNTTDKTVRFGLTSKDEMDIIFGYFYF